MPYILNEEKIKSAKPLPGDKKAWSELKKIFSRNYISRKIETGVYRIAARNSVWFTNKVLETLKKDDRFESKSKGWFHHLVSRHKKLDDTILEMMADAGFTILNERSELRRLVEDSDFDQIKFLLSYLDFAKNKETLNGLMQAYSDASMLDGCIFMAENYNVRLPEDIFYWHRFTGQYDQVKEKFHVFADEELLKQDKGYAASLLRISMQSEDAELQEKAFSWLSKFSDVLLAGFPFQDYDFDKIEPLAEKYLSENTDVAKAMSKVSLSRGDIASFEKWFSRAGEDMQTVGAEILSYVLKSRGDNNAAVEYLFDRGVDLGGASEYEAVIGYIAHSQSLSCVEKISMLDTGEEMLRRLGKDAAGLKQRYSAPFFISILDKASPTQENLEEYFCNAWYKDNLEVCDLLMQRGLDLGSLSEQSLRFLASNSTEEGLQKLIDQGLAFRGHVNAALKVSRNEKIQSLILNAYSEEHRRIYPKWEKQDDNTVAELSYVQKIGSKEYVLLRRSFNFRAGVVDQMHERHNDNGEIQVSSAGALPMRDVEPAMVETAKVELREKGGDPEPHLSVGHKKAKPILGVVKKS